MEEKSTFSSLASSMTSFFQRAPNTASRVNSINPNVVAISASGASNDNGNVKEQLEAPTAFDFGVSVAKDAHVVPTPSASPNKEKELKGNVSLWDYIITGQVDSLASYISIMSERDNDLESSSEIKYEQLTLKLLDQRVEQSVRFVHVVPVFETHGYKHVLAENEKLELPLISKSSTPLHFCVLIHSFCLTFYAELLKKSKGVIVPNHLEKLQSSSIECAKLLIEHGADVALVNDSGQTAYHLAVELKDAEFVTIFRSYRGYTQRLKRKVDVLIANKELMQQKIESATSLIKESSGANITKKSEVSTSRKVNNAEINGESIFLYEQKLRDAQLQIENLRKQYADADSSWRSQVAELELNLRKQDSTKKDQSAELKIELAHLNSNSMRVQSELSNSLKEKSILQKNVVNLQEELQSCKLELKSSRTELNLCQVTLESVQDQLLFSQKQEQNMRLTLERESDVSKREYANQLARMEATLLQVTGMLKNSQNTSSLQTLEVSAAPTATINIASNVASLAKSEIVSTGKSNVETKILDSAVLKPAIISDEVGKSVVAKPVVLNSERSNTSKNDENIMVSKIGFDRKNVENASSKFANEKTTLQAHLKNWDESDDETMYDLLKPTKTTIKKVDINIDTNLKNSAIKNKTPEVIKSKLDDFPDLCNDDEIDLCGDEKPKESNSKNTDLINLDDIDIPEIDPELSALLESTKNDVKDAVVQKPKRSALDGLKGKSEVKLSGVKSSDKTEVPIKINDIKSEKPKGSAMLIQPSISFGKSLKKTDEKLEKKLEIDNKLSKPEPIIKSSTESPLEKSNVVDEGRTSINKTVMDKKTSSLSNIHSEPETFSSNVSNMFSDVKKFASETAASAKAATSKIINNLSSKVDENADLKDPSLHKKLKNPQVAIEPDVTTELTIEPDVPILEEEPKEIKIKKKKKKTIEVIEEIEEPEDESTKISASLSNINSEPATFSSNMKSIFKDVKDSVVETGTNFKNRISEKIAKKNEKVAVTESEDIIDSAAAEPEPVPSKKLKKKKKVVVEEEDEENDDPFASLYEKKPNDEELQPSSHIADMLNKYVADDTPISEFDLKLLSNGSVMTKISSKNGKSHVTKVYLKPVSGTRPSAKNKKYEVSWDSESIFKSDADCRLPVEFCSLLEGSQSSAFSKAKLDDINTNLCFSVVSPDRSLDLVAKSMTDYHLWVSVLSKLIKNNK